MDSAHGEAILHLDRAISKNILDEISRLINSGHMYYYTVGLGIRKKSGFKPAVFLSKDKVLQ